MKDTSLDDFLEVGGDEDPDVAVVDPASVAPATTTYAVDPAGAACERCGEVVTARWRADDGLVCPACKDW